MQDKPPVSLYLDTRRPLANNKYPVKIRITWQIFKEGKAQYYVKYFSTDESLTPNEYASVAAGTSRGRLRESQEKIYKARAKAMAIIEGDPRISIDQFKAKYSGVYSTGVNIKDLFEEIIQEKLVTERIGTHRLFVITRDHFIEYAKGDFPLTAVDNEWLVAYEQAMVAKGKSLNTFGLYLRLLRQVFNLAIDKRLISADIYPFGRKGYQIRNKRTKKKALPVEIKNKLVDFKPTNEDEAECLDYLLFSYYANGINFRDMAYLNKRHFKGDHLIFTRRKTMHTAKEQKEIQVFLSKPLKAILERRAIHSPYLFGIINDDMSPTEQYKAVSLWITATNRMLKKVADKIGFKEKLTTYNARHTFVAALLNAGVSITKVADAVGHQSVLTTQFYGEDLDLEDSKKFSGLL